jgi:hypothetical protein
MFRGYPAHLQEVYVVIVYMQSLVSSLSAYDCLVHRLRKKERKKEQFFLNPFVTSGTCNSHLQPDCANDTVCNAALQQCTQYHLYTAVSRENAL